MSRWVSILGAGTIKVSENLTMTTTEQGTSIVSPSNANDLNGTVRFRVTSLPQTSPKLIGLEVDFSSLSAEVDGVAIFAAGDEIFKNRAFRKRGPFVLDVSTARDHAIQPEKGIAVTIYVTFGSAGSNITLDSVGLKILDAYVSQAPATAHPPSFSPSELQRLQDRVIELEKKMDSLQLPKVDPESDGKMITDLDQGRVGVSEHGVAGHVEAGLAQVARQWDGAATRYTFQRKFDRIPHVQITPDFGRDPTGAFQQFWLYFLSNGQLTVDREGFSVGVFGDVNQTVSFRWLALEVLPG